MNLDEVKIEIEKKLIERKEQVLNRNAFSALFGVFSDPVGALGKIFLGRQDALDQEQQKIAQELILKMLCDIDEVITQTTNEAKNTGVINIVSGTIEVCAENAERAIGVHITGSKATELKPGTHIKINSNNVKSTTGLKIENN